MHTSETEVITYAARYRQQLSPFSLTAHALENFLVARAARPMRAAQWRHRPASWLARPDAIPIFSSSESRDISLCIKLGVHKLRRYRAARYVRK